MSIPIDKELYEIAKQIVYKQYKKASAYRSGALVKKYKELVGRYKDDKTKKDKPLERWFFEKWININPNEEGYPVLRPSILVNKNTPTLATEITKKNVKEQIKLKEKIKGSKNLPPFKKK